jgi:glycosyltransferase involved in cell wall biosynthesis
MALPNKLFEYLHAGLPMVVSDCQAISEFVIANQLGTVFQAGSVEDLSRAIHQIYKYSMNDDTDQLKQKYSWQGQATHLVEVYRGKFPQLMSYDVWQADFCGEPTWNSSI